MRVWTLPVVALGVTMASLSLSDEPNEQAMLTAFEASLTAQVQNALDFVAESSGPEAVAKVREAGTDRFEIKSFRKLYCMPGEKAGQVSGHICSFAVDIGVRDGSLTEILLGRFFLRDSGLAFTHDT
jgi:hypothetical protein